MRSKNAFMELRRKSHVSFFCINLFFADRCEKFFLRSKSYRRNGSTFLQHVE